jgi:gamma-glutamyltranspeptidase/glutathione hydrolase
VTALAADPGLRRVFLHPDGSPRQIGEQITETELADTLERLGEHPREQFYRGFVAREIGSYLAQKGGVLRESDLREYKPAWRAALHRPYRSYEVYSMPPPSSGGGVLLEMMKMLEPSGVDAMGLNSPAYLARLIETMRQAFLDRAEYYGDPDFVSVPINFLLSPKHIDDLRQRSVQRLRKAVPIEDHGTSHLCVADADGNAVSLTTTINTAFGAKLMVPKLGIILNNEMDDFSLAPGVANVYGLVGKNANAIEPRKRPLSSMTPTIVTKNGSPLLVLGGSGGPTIISETLEIALDILDFHLDPERAIRVPRIHEQAIPETVMVEAEMPQATRNALSEMGYKLQVVPFVGAEQIIQITPEGLRGASDPRKGGGVEGY